MDPCAGGAYPLQDSAQIGFGVSDINTMTYRSTNIEKHYSIENIVSQLK